MADDFDQDYLMAARRAAQLRANPPPRVARSQLAIPVRAATPGRDFSLEQIGPGWSLYSNASIEGQLDPVGVVVEVQHRQGADPDTGEIIAATLYRCCRYWTPASPWVIIPASEVDTSQLIGLDRMSASVAARWLLGPVAPRSNRRRQQLSKREIDAITDAWRLARAVAL